MEKFKRIITPKGEAFWAHLVTPEVYNGEEVGYTVKVKFNKADTDKLVAKIEEEFEEFQGSPDQKGHKFSKEPSLGFAEDKNGDIMFKFKANSSYTDRRTGEKVARKAVMVFDAKKNRMKGDVGNGSVIICAISLIPYWISTKVNGIKLQLEAVQVISLQEYGTQNADAFGFDAEEGYVAADAEDENPFNDAPAPVDEDADF